MYIRSVFEWLKAIGVPKGLDKFFDEFWRGFVSNRIKKVLT
jgi:hypothetical protein